MTSRTIFLRGAPPVTPGAGRSRLHGAAVRAVATTVAALGALGTSLVIRAVADVGAGVSVLAVVLTITLRRVPHAGWRERATALVEVPLVAVAASGVGWLLVHRPWLGGPLLVLGLSVGIFARRYRPWVRQAGRVAALPFVALLVTPHVVTDDRGASVLWSALIALVALAWAMLPAAFDTRPAGPEAPPHARRRLDAPTRMALQMASGVAVALVVGHLLFGREWAWTVISAFLVQSGNRGRGDVVHKAGLRVIGSAGGTLLASAVASGLPSGHRVLIVAVFAVLAVALLLREISYAWWAAGVTAMMALLHAYYGVSGGGVVTDRLLGILTGSAIGLAAAWFVVPVRTAAVVRRRLADALAALTDDLAPDAREGGARFAAALARADELTPALRAHRRTARRGPHALDAIEALHHLEPLPGDAGERRKLRAATVRVRRSLVGRDDPPAAELPWELATVHTVLTSQNAHS